MKFSPLAISAGGCALGCAILATVYSQHDVLFMKIAVLALAISNAAHLAFTQKP